MEKMEIAFSNLNQCVQIGWELDEAGYHYVLDENRMKN